MDWDLNLMDWNLNLNNKALRKSNQFKKTILNIKERVKRTRKKMLVQVNKNLGWLDILIVKLSYQKRRRLHQI